MKTLIVYGSKHGTAEKCSKILKEKIKGEVVTVNIKNESVPDITSFDNVIIGGSIYAGQIQKEIKTFCSEKLNQLKDKRIGLFICGMNDKDVSMQINNSFPEELLKNSIAKEYFGGEVIFKNMNFFEKFIIKKVAKKYDDFSNISEENIYKFAQLVNKIS